MIKWREENCEDVPLPFNQPQDDSHNIKNWNGSNSKPEDKMPVQTTGPRARRLPLSRPKCPYCGKRAETKDSTDFGGATILNLECGHSIAQSELKQSDPVSSITSLDGRKLYDFQAETIRLGEKAGGSFQCSHQQGLGKTVIGAGMLKLHPEMLPAVIVCKSKLKRQWIKELVRWAGPEFIAQEVGSAKDNILDFFKVYVITFDMLPRMPKTCTKCGQKKAVQGEYCTKKILTDGTKCGGLLKDVFSVLRNGKGPMTVIIDETQRIKNPAAARTYEMMRFCQDVPYRIGLSGTPTQNNAREYWTILHILRPELFPTYKGFDRRWIGYYFDSVANNLKPGGIADHKWDEFKELTGDFIFRKTREEVMPDLPVVKRNFQYIDIDDEALQRAYSQVFDEFEVLYDAGGRKTFGVQGQLLAVLGKLRHITGLAKAQYIADEATEFAANNDTKVAIFVHHVDVAQVVRAILQPICKERGWGDPLMFGSDLNDKKLEKIQTEFNDPGNNAKFAICSTQSMGEGLNLQYDCNTMWMAERQWNPAIEEQAESRFTRPDSPAMHGFVDCYYPVVIGTIDEWLSSMDEHKREANAKSVGDKTEPWDESASMSALASKLHEMGKPKWKLSSVK